MFHINININRNTMIAAACTIALLLAAAVGVDAQSNEPIGLDEPVACVASTEGPWIAPQSLQLELELHSGSPAEVLPMDIVLDNLPPAGPGRTVHFEGAVPSEDVSDALDALGYTTRAFAIPVLPSAQVALDCTD